MVDRVKRFPVAVLGGGLFGSALTYHLARFGSGPPLLLERGEVGSGTTAASAGILTFPGWDPWDLRLVQDTAKEYRTLSEQTGTGSYRRNGGLHVARTESGARWLATVQSLLAHEGVEARLVEASGLEPIVPAADLSDVRVALHSPSDAVVDARALAAVYSGEAQRLGAAVRTASGEPRLTKQPGAGWRIDGAGTSIEVSRLVLATGPWTKKVLATQGLSLPIAPFRSRAARLRPAPLAPPTATLHDGDLAIYVRPAPDGRVVFGDGSERTESDPDAPTGEGDDGWGLSTLARLRTVYPGWRSANLEASWSGMCVATPDRFPLVGRVPGGESLYVATGFNGFGVMRTAALARRLAEAILNDRWEPLAPADPARFAGSSRRFHPDPRYPLETDPPPSGWPSAGVPLGSDPPDPETITFTPLRTRSEVDGCTLPSLSDWFDPFLRFFLLEALRAGGRAEVASVDGVARGVYLWSPAEETGSVFTHVRSIARHYRERGDRGGLYAEFDEGPPAHRIQIFAAELEDWAPGPPLRNRVRIAEPSDLPNVRAFLERIAGPVDEVWFRGLPPEETCFLAEDRDRVTGVSWATIVGTHARGHTFVVHPRYRGLGVGTDLLHGRMRWLRERGILRVVSEIYAGNAASQIAAEAAGMAYVGDMYHYRSVGAASPTDAAPRTADTPSPSNR
jgi:sarcosine oxidase, subunit beta